MVVFGNVCDVDRLTHRVRVELKEDRITTHFLPVIVSGSGGDKYFVLPKVGDFVACAMNAGMMEGVCLGAVYSSANQTGISGDVHRVEFEDGTVVEFDQDAGKLTVEMGGTTVELSAAGVNVEANGQSLKSILLDIVNANIAETHTGNSGAPTSPPLNVASYNAILPKINSLFT